MREILFRGKRIDNGNWVEGFYVKASDPFLHSDEMYDIIFRNDVVANLDIDRFDGYRVVCPETVGQFTGLLDIEGRKIFEGDIMKTAIGGLKQHIGVVEFLDGAYGLKCTDGDGFFLCFVAGNYKIVGNIHDNPELLEGE